MCIRDRIRPAGPPHGRIRELNDLFRTKGVGRGSIVISEGIHAKGADFARQALSAVRAFNNFGEDNDPWGEHDFGAVTINEEKVFWKFDYLDPSLTVGSENPANEGQTVRVLTIMLAHEY